MEKVEVRKSKRKFPLIKFSAWSAWRGPMLTHLDRADGHAELARRLFLEILCVAPTLPAGDWEVYGES
jgi:hypothetical protein